jgi:3-oxoacyl-[acyl-carrier-protein] synthase-1
MAAIRAGISNARATRFIDWGGEWIAAHAVELPQQHLRSKLVQMAAMAVDECLAGEGMYARPEALRRTAFLLCLPEASRPGLCGELDETMASEILEAAQAELLPQRAVFRLGRAGGLVALQQARMLLDEGRMDAVLIAGVDSHIDWPALNHFESCHRLLTSRNSNGFMPGEAAAALLVTRPKAGIGLRCDGLGFAMEEATVDSDLPLRGDGLVKAITAAAGEAGCRPGEFELRISALTGEHYYFKEAALALTRLARETGSDAELWHPADCVGEVGAACGPLVIALAAGACRRGHAPRRILCHVSNDGMERGAAFISYGDWQ